EHGGIACRLRRLRSAPVQDAARGIADRRVQGVRERDAELAGLVRVADAALSGHEEQAADQHLLVPEQGVGASLGVDLGDAKTSPALVVEWDGVGVDAARRGYRLRAYRHGGLRSSRAKPSPTGAGQRCRYYRSSAVGPGHRDS